MYTVWPYVDIMAYQETTSDYLNLSIVILSLFKLWMLSGVKQLINSTEKTFKGYEYTVTEFTGPGSQIILCVQQNQLSE